MSVHICARKKCPNRLKLTGSGEVITYELCRQCNETIPIRSRGHEKQPTRWLWVVGILLLLGGVGGATYWTNPQLFTNVNNSPTKEKTETEKEATGILSLLPKIYRGQDCATINRITLSGAKISASTINFQVSSSEDEAGDKGVAQFNPVANSLQLNNELLYVIFDDAGQVVLQPKSKSQLFPCSAYK